MAFKNMNARQNWRILPHLETVTAGATLSMFCSPLPSGKSRREARLFMLGAIGSTTAEMYTRSEPGTAVRGTSRVKLSSWDKQ